MMELEVVRAEVDTEGRKIVRKDKIGADTAGISTEPVNVIWKKSGEGHLIAEHQKPLTERFNEAYSEEAKQEDEEFVKHLKRYHRRRFSDEW